MADQSAALTLQRIQTIVDGWISQWEEGYFSPMANLACLVEEVGELSRELNDRFGEKPKKPTEAAGDIGMEMADILFVLVCIANDLDIDLSAAFKRAMAKYDERDGQRWTPVDDPT